MEVTLLVYSDEGQKWKTHDNYKPDVSHSRIVTRSQTAFKRIKKTKSDLKLISDAKYFKPPNFPHLMMTMKGEYGNTPRTIVTRSTGEELSQTKKLNEDVNKYMHFAKQDPKFQESSAEKYHATQKKKEELLLEHAEEKVEKTDVTKIKEEKKDD